MINVAQLLASQQPYDAPARPMMEAQRMELRARFADYHDDSRRPEPGDLVVEKAGMGTLKKEMRPTVQLMLWRLLDPGNAVDWAMIADHINRTHSNGVDCIVVSVCDDGAHLNFIPHERAQLRRIPDEASS